MSVDDRLEAIERRLDALRVPPVRDELLSLRDAYGARLSAIEARLTAIEGDLGRGFDSVSTWLAEIDRKLDGRTS